MKFPNWRGLSKEDEAARRNAWLDAILGELERHYPGFAGAVGEKTFMSAASMERYLGTPGGAIYGFDPYRQPGRSGRACRARQKPQSTACFWRRLGAGPAVFPARWHPARMPPGLPLRLCSGRRAKASRGGLRRHRDPHVGHYPCPSRQARLGELATYSVRIR